MRGVWMARLLLAALLAFSLEVVLWPQTPGRAAADLALAMVSYMALAAALADGMLRLRVRDVNGLLALAGLAAFASGLLIHPQVALDNAPYTILTRMLGAPTLACLLALVSWLALLRGRLTGGLLLAAALSGAVFGLYGRWFPSVVDASTGETPLDALLVVAGVALALIALARAAMPRSISTADQLRLSRAGWIAVALVASGLLALRLAQGVVDGLSLAIVAALFAFTALVSRLYGRKRDVTLLARALPVGRARPTLALAGVAFFALTLVTYALPRADSDADPLGLLGSLLIAFGVAWLPALSLVIGARALSRQVPAPQL